MKLSSAKPARSMAGILAAMFMDAVIVTATLWWALLLRFEGTPPTMWTERLLVTVPVTIVTALVAGELLGLYRIVPRYTSLGEIWRLAKVVGVVAVALMVVTQGHYLVMGNRLAPLSIPLIWAPSAFLLLAAPRTFRRLLAHLGRERSMPADAERILIAGAGDAGERVVRDMLDNPAARLKPVGFLDDDPGKIGKRIHGLPVLGPIKSLDKAVGNTSADKVVIALPNASSQLVRSVTADATRAGVEAQIIPTLAALMGDEPTTADIRDVDIGDLIGRYPVQIDIDQIARIFEGRVVLVSGAAGSIGSELSRQALRFRPSKLILLDTNETDLYLLGQSLLPMAGPKGSEVVMVLADIRDRHAIDCVFEKYSPALVLHAAAYKHVPVMQDYPAEAVKTNIAGTRILATAASSHGAERFILVSTDKAVNPTSVMGATKRVAEMVLSSLAADSSTVFASVRFGNVLGSRGSVVPILAEQIKRGGPITVTHEDATRYFMTIKEAAALICQAGAIASGGETFVLEMGEPVRIMDLAVRMRDLLVTNEAQRQKIEIVFTGLRPGEKLNEDLWRADETLQSVQPGILRCRPAIDSPGVDRVDEKIRELEQIALQATGPEELLKKLEELAGHYSTAATP